MTLVLTVLGPIVAAGLGVVLGAWLGRERDPRYRFGARPHVLPRPGEPGDVKLALAASDGKPLPKRHEPRRSLAQPAEALAQTGTD
jgi:hypothetical protein